MTLGSPDLPRPLRPWQPWLGWFDARLAEQVGEMVRRLSELVGPAAASGHGGPPEPDGLGDLRSRGPYERLLASEWLMAEELPDEFMRRAATSEHLFLAPQMRAAQVERSVVALFDCGPRALGAARIAHLAAWILLARRADEQGGTLRWGVLQAPGALHPADAPTRLGDLMRARRMDAATAAHVVQWRETIAASADAGEREIWWIGAPGPDIPDGSRRDERVLTLRALLAGDALETLLATPGMQRRATLPLPPVADTTALLRGEFRTLEQTPRLLPDNRTLRAKRLSLTQGLLMSAPPGHVAVPELGQAAMLVFAVPRRGQQKLARPRRQQWSSSRSLLAQGLRGSEVVGVTGLENKLQFWQMPGFPEQDRPSREAFQATNSTGRVLPMMTLRDPNLQLACVIDAAGQLVAWRASTQPTAKNSVEPGVTVLDRQVRVMVPLGPASLAYAMVWGDGIWLRKVGTLGQASTLNRRLCPAPDQLQEMFATVLGFGTSAAQVGSLGFAHRLQSGTVWQIFTIQQLGRGLDDIDGAHSTEVRIADGERAVGLVNQRGTKPPALVVLSADRRRLRLSTAQSQTTLYESAAVIERCSVCPIAGHVAVLARDRRLVVLDPVNLDALLIVTDNEPALATQADNDVAHELDHDDV